MCPHIIWGGGGGASSHKILAANRTIWWKSHTPKGPHTLLPVVLYGDIHPITPIHSVNRICITKYGSTLYVYRDCYGFCILPIHLKIQFLLSLSSYFNF